MTDAYRDADNGSQSLIGISFALLALTTVFFAGFLYSKHCNAACINQLMFWLIVCAYILNTGNAVVNALCAILGKAGKHIHSLDHGTYIASGKLGKASDYLYIPSAILPKLAMLTFYAHVFPGRMYKWTINGCAALLICSLVAGLLQTTLICKPFRAYWDDGTCGNMMASYRWLSYPNLITDFVMLVMPFPALLKLHVSKATKIKLVLTFMMGSLGIITAILRLVCFYTIPIFDDATWYLIQPGIYSVVEPSAYLICAIMPTLRHLVKRRSQPSNRTTALHTSSSSYPDQTPPSPSTTTAISRSPTKLDNNTISIPKVYRPSIFSPSKLLSRFSGTSTFTKPYSQQENDKSGAITTTTTFIDEPDLELGKVGLSPRERHATSNHTEVGTGDIDMASSSASRSRRCRRKSSMRIGGGSGSCHDSAGEACKGMDNALFPNDVIMRKTDINMISEPLAGEHGKGWRKGFGTEEADEGENVDVDALRSRSVESAEGLGGKIGGGLDTGMALDGDGDEVPLNNGFDVDKARMKKRRSVIAVI